MQHINKIIVSSLSQGPPVANHRRRKSNPQKNTGLCHYVRLATASLFTHAKESTGQEVESQSFKQLQ